MTYQFDRVRYNERMKWYLHNRFGLFLHFGLYSIPARGEWVRSDEEMNYISPTSMSSTPMPSMPASGHAPHVRPV